MSGRPSAATEKALRLYAKSGNKSQAARKAGIAWTTLHRAIQRQAVAQSATTPNPPKSPRK